MKKIALAAALASAALLSVSSVHAVDVPAAFTVQVGLTSKCQIQTAATTIDFGTYVAFGAAGTPAPTTAVTFECTRGLVPTVAFDVTNGTTSASAATATAEGVLTGLRYTLSVAAPVVGAGTIATAGVGGVGGGNGTAATRAYTITGGMPSGQAGNCATATCTGSHSRSLIVTY